MSPAATSAGDDQLLPYECRLSTTDTLHPDRIAESLARIVGDLHAIAQWTAMCQQRIAACEAQHAATTQQVALLVRTEIELLRHEQRVECHDVLQRCLAQTASMQSALRAELDERVGELQVDWRRSMQQIAEEAQSAAAEAARSECEEQIRRAELRQIEQRESSSTKSSNAVEMQRDLALSQSVATLVAAVDKQQRELTLLQQRVQNGSTALALKLDRSHAVLMQHLDERRKEHSQLASKMQIARKEMQERTATLSASISSVKSAVVEQCMSPSRSSHSTTTWRAIVAPSMTPSIAMLVAPADDMSTEPRGTADAFVHASASLPPSQGQLLHGTNAAKASTLARPVLPSHRPSAAGAAPCRTGSVTVTGEHSTSESPASALTPTPARWMSAGRRVVVPSKHASMTTATAICPHG